mmetsp:Transcript_8977/g.25035  ORF Transcript_8977/g.25035 Transcript_8977/m.25035 type:complete len:278 (-) Transcript_8977:369-1202(-)
MCSRALAAIACASGTRPTLMFQWISGFKAPAKSSNSSNGPKLFANLSARRTMNRRSAKGTSRSAAQRSLTVPLPGPSPASNSADLRHKAATSGFTWTPKSENATRRDVPLVWAPRIATTSHASSCAHGAKSHPAEPDMASRKRPTSRTQRPIGPLTPWRPSKGPEGVAPSRGTTPGETRKPTTPQKAAGVRKEPPRSEPLASQHSQLARAAADPPLLPPAVVRVSHGDTVVGNSELKHCEPAANSGTLVFPTMMAPLASSWRATGPLDGAIRSPNGP